MKTIKAKDLDFYTVQINKMDLLPVIRTEDIPNNGIIYLVVKGEFASAEDEDEIHLYYSKIEKGQIQNEEGKLTGYPGLQEKRKNLTVII